MKLDDLNDDFQHHIELETRDNIERGMSPADARAAALRKFGNLARATEDTYAVWHRLWLDRLRQDLRYAWRALRNNPGFAAIAIATLALGIGMNTALFSVVNAVLLRPLPYPDADRLVWLATYNERFKLEAVTGPDYFDWKQQAQSFDAMAGYEVGQLTLGFPGAADQTGVVGVTPDFFAFLGARPSIGRLIGPGDRNAIVLTHRLYARRFGADPSALGTTISVNGVPHTICGVLPESFRFVLPFDAAGAGRAEDVEAYVTSQVTPETQSRGRTMRIVAVIARLRPELTVRQARAEMETIHSNIARANPGPFYNDAKLRIQPLQDKLVGERRGALLILAGAGAFVLLIACANMANLLLSRAGARQREIAIRAAIGAGRSRMIAQLLAEGLALSLAGGVAGIGLARLALAALIHFGPQAVPRLAEASIDLHVLGFTLVLSTLTGLIFGLGPAISLSRANLAGVLKDGGRIGSASPGRLRVRRILMAGELAVALVLLTGAGLMIRSFARMNAHPPGFAPERIVTMQVALTGPNYRGTPEQVAYFVQALERLAAAPGVRASGIANSAQRGFVNVEGISYPDGQAPQTTYNCSSSGYFTAMGMRLVAGRWLTDNEPAAAALINDSFARVVFGSASPIGRRLRVANGPNSIPTTIVGVVGDLKYSRLDAEPAPEVYLPFRQAPFLRRMTVMIRAAGDPMAVGAAARQALASIDPTQPVFEVQTLENALADTIAPRRFNLFLLAVFAAVALVLSVVGIYGVMSYAVQQRAHEIGVRMALGARRGEVLAMVARQGMVVALAGIAVGVGGALALTRLIATLLYAVEPTDPPTFIATALTLTVAALAACVAPALRASRVDPVIALRYE